MKDRPSDDEGMRVFYTAVHDEIVILHPGLRFERGCQGIIVSKELGPVPDYFSLFLWKVGYEKFQMHKNEGWLVELGDL